MENKKKILVIEDEKLIAEALTKKLSSAGYDYSVAYDGEEGLKMALDQKPDLILLDLILPKKDGMSVLDDLRHDDWGKDVPIIILTNLDTDEEFEESRKRGVTDYLIKTNWTLDDVVKKIEGTLKK